MNKRDGLSPETQRFLDGEIPANGVSAPERAEAERLAEAVSSYASRIGAPGVEVDRAVMAAVRARPVPFGQSLWRWLFEPRVVRVRPLLAAAAVVAMVAIGAVGVSLRQRTPVAVVADGAETILVRFELRAPDAESVTLAGSFNDWQADQIQLTKSPETGLWTGTVPLVPGEHQYLFVIDGARWIPDPSAHAQIDDGFGQTNSVIIVGPRGMVRS